LPEGKYKTHPAVLGDKEGMAGYGTIETERALCGKKLDLFKKFDNYTPQPTNA